MTDEQAKWVQRLLARLEAQSKAFGSPAEHPTDDMLRWASAVAMRDATALGALLKERDRLPEIALDMLKRQPPPMAECPAWLGRLWEEIERLDKQIARFREAIERHRDAVVAARNGEVDEGAVAFADGILHATLNPTSTPEPAARDGAGS